MKNLLLVPNFHRQQTIIKTNFTFNKELIVLVKTLKEARWGKTLNSRYFPKKEFHRKQYLTSSVRAILRRSAKNTGIRKRIYSHLLRRSFTTHLLEKGTYLRYIQELVGHGSSKTTEIYTHLSKKSLANTKSPLDHIIEQQNTENKRIIELKT